MIVRNTYPSFKIGRYHWLVNLGGGTYVVVGAEVDGGVMPIECSCPHFQYRHITCKHMNHVTTNRIKPRAKILEKVG